MDLKTVLPKGKGKKKEYYWSLVLEQGWVQAGVWSIIEGTSNVVSVGPPTPWETFEELVNAADTALSAVVQKLEKDIGEPTKTVIGVPSSWVDAGNISSEYLSVIKRICTELSLKPAGFVVLSEAIAHLVKSKEGAPLTGIVVGVGSKNIDISLFKSGEVKKNETVSRSVSTVDDVVEGLVRFATSETLPSRFLLYNGKKGELDEAKQSLVSYDWQAQDKLKFLHVPSVESVNPEDKVLAVSLAGGVEIAGAESVKVTKDEDSKVSEEESNVVDPGASGVSPQELGFVVGQDVAREAISNSEEKKAGAGAEEDKAVSSTKADEQGKAGSKESSSQIPQDTEAATQQPQEVATKGKSLFSKLPFIGKEKAEAIDISGQQTVKPGKLTRGKLIAIAALLIFVGILVAGFVAWWNLPKASVTIYVSPEKIEGSVEVFVDTNSTDVDPDTSTIPGKKVESGATGEETKSTTGSKTVGEKSKGTVEIRNGTSSAVRIAAGSKLTASNDLEFVTDTSASVSAALSTTEPGTESVDVTAVDIGSDYNLAKDEVLSVEDYTKAEVEAVTTSDFSGGSSKQISSVNTEDQEQLEESLEEELVGEAINELKDGLDPGEVLIEDSVVVTTMSREFSAKVDDEADTLKLSLEISVDGIVVKEDDLLAVVEKELGGRVPEGFVLRGDQVDVDYEFKDEEGGVYQVEVSVVANLLPEVKPDEIASKIAGKYPQLAKDYLNNVPGFSRAEIKLTPSLPGRLGTLPHVQGNITIEISAER